MLDFLLESVDVADFRQCAQFLQHLSGRQFFRREALRHRFEFRLLAFVKPGEPQQCAEFFQQHLQPHRFHHVSVMPARRGIGVVLVTLAFTGVGGNHDDGRNHAVAAQGLRQLPARHAGHGYIQQESIGVALAGQRQTISTTRCFHHAKTQRRQQIADQATMGRIVIHHHQQFARTLVAADLFFHHRCFAGRVDARQHQADSEGAANTGLALHGDVAAHDIGEQTGDGEAQPGAGHRIGAGFAHPFEGPENAFDIVLVDADAAVADGELGHLAAVAHAERHAAPIGELDGIRQQVDQDLAQALFIGGHVFRQKTFVVVFEQDAFCFRLQPEHLHDLIQQRTDAHLVAVQVEPAGFYFGNIQQSFDQIRQMFAAAADSGNGLAPGGWNLIVLLQQLRVTQHRVERRAQFVADAGEIAALGMVRRFRHFLRFLQRQIGTFVSDDFLFQQARLPLRFLLRHLAAFVRQNKQPGHHARHDQQDEKFLPQHGADQFGGGGIGDGNLVIHQSEQQADAAADQQQQAEEMAKP